jgi:HK97 family phage major capsid protein
MNATTFGQGGATVPLNIDPEVVELLRNRTVCERMGVKRIAGLSGNVGIPRHTASVTPYSLPEQATLVKATSTFDQILVTPHRVGCWQNYTRQLALTSGIDVEMFLREDLLAAMNVKTDSLILIGQGSQDEPCGILNTTGVGSLVFGGTPTWSQMLSFETMLANANADCRPNGRYGFITSPSVKNRLKAILKTGTGVSSTLANAANFIWEVTGDISGDGFCNGYRAAATNQVPNNLVFFGNWADCVLAMFGTGVDLVVDPYTQATDATTRVVMNQFIDVAVRHAASFVISADSGAQ